MTRKLGFRKSLRDTPTRPVYKLRCDLCQQNFETINLKSFGQTARKHREKSHPDHRGALRYGRIFD